MEIVELLLTNMLNVFIQIEIQTIFIQHTPNI